MVTFGPSDRVVPLHARVLFSILAASQIELYCTPDFRGFPGVLQLQVDHLHH